MSGHKASVKPAKCSGHRKDGSACNSFSVEAGLCAWHLRLRDAGDTNEPVLHRGPVELLPLEAEPDVVRGDEATGGGIRQHFQAAATTNQQKIVDSLVETLDAFSANRKVRCPNPRCNLEFPVQVPDAGARVKASEALVSLGYGTPPKDDSKAASVDLGVDPFSLDADELRAYREALTRAYPEEAARFTARVAEERERERTPPRKVSAVVPRKRQP